MKTIYIDSEYRCFIKDGDGRTEIQTDVFDGKCDSYICGCRYVPDGHSWTDEHGIIHHGEMLCAIGNYELMAFAQSAYEDGQRNILSEVEGALGL